MAEVSLFQQCTGTLDATDPANLASIVECIATRQEQVSENGRASTRRQSVGISCHVVTFWCAGPQ